jgi:Sec-independent protein translocase protein TatA
MCRQRTTLAEFGGRIWYALLVEPTKIVDLGHDVGGMLGEFRDQGNRWQEQIGGRDGELSKGTYAKAR